MTRRVLFVQPNAEWYGSDRAFVLLAQWLHEAGWSVEPIVPAEGRIADELRAAGVEPHVADPGVPRPRAWARARLVRWALSALPRSCLGMWRRARAADLVHLNASNVLGALLGAALARRPVLLHFREYQPAVSRGWRIYVAMIRPFVDRVLAVSEDVAGQARRAGFGDRVVVVHDGLRFEPGPIEHEVGVLSVGRINEWKGHEVLVEAVARLRSRGVDVPVRIAGDAFPGTEHLVDELRRLIDARGVSDLVTLLGFVEDVDALHQQASIFVSAATRPEPFGLALLDAMASGCAPIASDAGGPREIVTEGETGLLVPPGDAESLADALERLWTDPERTRRIGEAAAADVRRRFSIDRAGAAVADEYTRLLTGRT